MKHDHKIEIRVRFQTSEPGILENAVDPNILLHDTLFPGQSGPEFRENSVVLEPVSPQNRFQVQNCFVEVTFGYWQTHFSPI